MREQLALRAACCAVILGVSMSGQALADDKFSIENLSPAASQRTSIVSVYGTETHQWGEWELNALVSYARRPLAVEDTSGDRVGDLIGSIGTLNLMGTLGIASWLDFSVAMPLHRASEGSVFTGPARLVALNDLDSIRDEADIGPGDLRLVPRIRLLQGRGVGLGVIGTVFLPTGKKDAFMSEGLRLEPRLAVDFKHKDLRIAANVGYLVRPSTNFIPDNQIDDAMVWGAGVDAPLVSALHLIAEIDGWVGTSAGPIEKSQTPIEWRAGPRIVAGGFLAQLGAGTAVVRGIGAPYYRLYASVGYAGMDADLDDDGIDDDKDNCPKDAEDRDGFQDQDGCPEADNDTDGVADGKDGAPNDPEDKDGFQDEDGVPDGDNDSDSVPDGSDGAPNDPEDKDGFQDEDGVPDPDNDGDTVLDAADKCPLLAGLPEHGGCAPADGDGDGVIDGEDKCPTEAGTVENKGCPLVQVTATNLVISDKVYFDNNADVIQERSFALLDAVAQSLATHPEVEEVSVEGHTDNVGKPAKNLKLSKRRAASVVKYLVDKGVAAERLKSKGFGQTNPIGSNDTEEGKGENRRVELVITKRKEAEASVPKEGNPPATAPAAPAPITP